MKLLLVGFGSVLCALMAKVTITIEDIETPDGETVTVNVEFEPHTPEIHEQTAAHKLTAVMMDAGRKVVQDVTGDTDWGLHDPTRGGMN